MNKDLEHIKNAIEQAGLSINTENEKLLEAIRSIDKELTILEFKLQRTEKVKRTTSVLLEETIAELEKKRNSIEAQNRKLEIEAALERVRARIMAMQKSNELREVVSVIYKEVERMGVDVSMALILIYNRETKNMVWWSSGHGIDILPESYQIQIAPEVENHPWLSRYYDAQKNNTDYEEFQLKGDIKKTWDKYMFEQTDMKKMPEKFKQAMLSYDSILLAEAFMKCGVISISIQKSLSVGRVEMLKRFAKVVDLTFTRIKELQKAEEQAREAQIEVALERIRAQAMAMQHSDDLLKCTTILFEEFDKLNLSVERSGIGIFDRETRDCELWTTVVTNDNLTEITTGITSLTVHPLLTGTFDAWESQESFAYILQGKEQEDYYNFISKGKFHLPLKAIKHSSSLPKEYYFYTPFGAGGLYVFSGTEPSQDEKQIIQRFADVFHLTYTRYQDLQKSEVRAQEAVRQASLDRVRGEISSMRTTNDLKRIIPLIWKELKIVGVPFFRCGMMIIDADKQVLKTHLSSPDGKSLGIFDLPKNSAAISVDTYKAWEKQENFQTHWNKDEFVGFMKSLLKTGKITAPETYQDFTAPPESLHLNFIPFKQGMLYLGNDVPLLKDELLLVEALAKAFSIAYSRYEDFVNLENAKNKIEATLHELKSTQSQLIQSEKMASLGELTAGIAHEIQNPLNFVNNFAEVSNELIVEMNEEMDNGDIKEAKEISVDIRQNLEKINHHGKRAEAIVKGMLQHSRGNSGKKELTNIVELADEFLRLSYHGLRAKDKSFNADFKLEADESIPKINIVPQDIGRVLLNLINNAFYAVSEKAKQNIDSYKPLVAIAIKVVENKIEIRVKDNGNGIPDSIKKKIFQPFFTTKPTGSGTGLGLSLSYDIVKAHGGKISVESKQNTGTEFIILLINA